MTTTRQLQLKDTHFEECLHGGLPDTREGLFDLMDALDFVVLEWSDSMARMGLRDQASQTAEMILTENIITRLAIYSLLDESSNSEEDLDFVGVMKQLNTLSQAYVHLAKSYAKTPQLSHWYLNLPIKVASAFKAIRQKERMEAIDQQNRLNNQREGIYK